MRTGTKVTLLSAVLMLGVAPLAYGQTLDGQMQRRDSTTTTTTEWPAGAAATRTTSSTVVAPTSGYNAIDSEGEGAIPALPLDLKTSANGIHFISGGIGDEEVSELKSLAANYNVHFLITGPGGEYLSEAQVRIVDDKGAEVLSADDIGPYLYVSLPSGKYTFEVTTAQRGSKQMEVMAPAKGSVKPQLRFDQ